MIIFLLLLFFPHHIYSAGFSGDTLLLTKDGQTTFEKIDYNVAVQSQHNHFQSIVFLSKQAVEKVVHISFLNETIICHKKQLFWCVNQHDWTCAEDLKAGDLLQTINKQSIVIDAIQIITQQAEIYSLTVGPPHHLYIGKHAVLAHNVPWVIAASTSLAVSTGAVEFIKASVVPLLSVIALKICDLCAKHRDKKKQKTSISARSVCNSPQFDPNDDKNKSKHPHGIYEDADYHGLCQNGRKSPRPKDGQKALDNSYEFNAISGGRVTISDNQFVVLRRHLPGRYHGYTCEWEKLHVDMRKILEDLKMVNSKGKILWSY